MPKPAIGPSRLSQILQKLQSDPKPVLRSSLKKLKLTYAVRNDHFGARHFVKEELPRIRYVNPTIAIEVDKFPKTEADTWQSSLVMEFEDGSKKSFTMDNKWSSAIFTNVMDAAGTQAWDRWKADRKAAHLPIVDGPPNARSPPPPSQTRKGSGAAAVLP
ncbi:hypothetical protein BJ322DRAFT_1012710 [Thelephora terrestris]|uniref:Ribosomal protein/NADH dehydrogenase domain-containing protein n=1 Tax=Thelephora terrestris TaxID=56493 RepID=A0A9P6L227_9AGAM|nr:hypothetical protein BJ322DRAFT_1012710 [Thelephora terrestris]